MSFVLRKLNNKAAFHPVDWIEEGNVQADVFSSLRTTGNSLSVWVIDKDRTNLNRIVAAMAAGRDTLDKLDYALIDKQELDPLGIQSIQEKGKSADENANISWHEDIKELSGIKLLDLAVLIKAKAELKRVQKNDIRNLIVNSINRGYISPSRIKDQLREKLGLERT